MANCRGAGFVSGLLLGGLVGLGLAWLRGRQEPGELSERPLEESRAALRARFAGPTSPTATASTGSS
ncbi:MAG TPA: hypothetical protein VKZ60_13850 [Chloroflexota bacterium]|nr:hypothetical protein [Chloroflexota bacterium]